MTATRRMPHSIAALATALAGVSLVGCGATPSAAPAPEGALWSALLCEGRSFQVAYVDGQAWLQEGSQRSRLAQAVSASGARFTGRHAGVEAELWEKGGNARLSLGDRSLECIDPLQLPWRPLACGESAWQVAFGGERAWLRFGGTVAVLALDESAPSPSYRGRWLGEPIALMHQGRSSSLRLGSAEPQHCDARAEYAAQGNEPFWRIEQHADVLELSRLGSAGLRAGRIVALEGASAAMRLQAQWQSASLALLLESGPCRDSMSGLPFPDVVRVELEGEVLQGCGGDPSSLLSSKGWMPESAVASPRTAILRFAEDGLLAFDGPCNLHRGRWQLDGEGLQLSFGPSTLMACEGAIEAEERRLLAQLQATARHDFDAAGNLILQADDGGELRLVPAPGN